MTIDGQSGRPHEDDRRGQDASQLMKAACWFLVTGVAALVLVLTVFGGVHEHGPHTNGGWVLLVLGLMCIPLGILLLLLGGAKWLRAHK
jgi:hypothetical protein